MARRGRLMVCRRGKTHKMVMLRRMMKGACESWRCRSWAEREQKGVGFGGRLVCRGYLHYSLW